MRGYDRDDMDEYEDDGFIEHDEEQGEYEEDGEEEEEEEKEVRKPTKEELDYLEIRQRIKESMRKKMKKENGAVTGISQVKKKLPYDNYGSFFGPSQPVIAQRVIQESKSLLENQHLTAARVSSSHHNLQSKKSTSSTTSTSRPGGREAPPKVVNVVKQKVQTLRDSRDYSFLLSDDAELPAPSRAPPPFKVSVPNSAHASSKSPKLGSSSSRPVPNVREQRTQHVSMGHQMQSKPGQHKVASGSRPNSTLANPRKQLGSSAANGPGRPLGTKSLPSKMPVPTKTPTSNRMSIPNKVPASNMDKKASVAGVKRPLPGVQKAPSPRSHSSVTGVQRTLLPKSHSSGPGVQKASLSKSHPSEQRREIREQDRGRLMSKQSVSSSRPQIKPPPKQNPSRAPMQNDRPKKRPTRPFADEDDDDNAISMIRNMFRYNPKKYAKIDEDDSDMEAGFDDILEEEKYSTKVAREEDERELRLIEEEERRERMRKEAKRRKLSQR